jgi:hypothetical protein
LANNQFRNPANTQVAQIYKATINTTTNGHTYIVTMTDDNGDTAAITYTVVNPPDTTVTLVAAGFIAAWNASVIPLIQKFTATQLAGQVILTAVTAGVPGSFAASGTGTWSGTGNTTENVGNSDYGTARNWQRDAVPVATDDVLFDAADSGDSVDLLYGLNQSAVAIADFRVFPGYVGDIGRFEQALGHYLRIDPDLFRHEGGGQLGMFDIGNAAIDVYINSVGRPIRGRYGCYIKGSAIATLRIVRGVVGVAPLDADTAIVTTLELGYVGNQASDAQVVVGLGVTLTTVNQSGGDLELRCAATTVTNGKGSILRTEGSGAFTTINVLGDAILNSSGTITTLNVFGRCDLTHVRTPRTITTTIMNPGAYLITGPWITHTNKIAPASTGAGPFTVELRQ